jgi:hypothetical protein
MNAQLSDLGDAGPLISIQGEVLLRECFRYNNGKFHQHFSVQNRISPHRNFPTFMTDADFDPLSAFDKQSGESQKPHTFRI